MDSTNTGMSPADFAAMAGNNNWNDGNCWWVILFFLIIFGGYGNGFGWGNNNNGLLDSTLAASAAQGGYVTSNQMNDALRLQSIQQGQRDIVDAVNSNKYDIVNANSASEARLIENQANLLAGQAANSQALQACCSTINYNGAMNTASINANTTAQIQKVLDTIQQNKIDTLQQQVTNLQFQNALGNVVRYPSATTYSSGMNPFCGCGCTNV